LPVTLAIALESGAPAATAQEHDIGSFFPPALTENSQECRLEALTFKQPILSRTEVQWFSEHLASAGESALFPKPDGTRSVLRFTWLRTFHEPVVVRLQERDDGRQHLVAKRLSGAGGYEPGTVDETVERDLTAEESRALSALLAGLDLQSLAPSECGPPGLDGAVWLFETASNGDYRLYKRRSPGSGEIRELGLFLLRLTRWNNEPIY
jgi:hypothetical protein